ncbi:hypothetical protein AKJ16_DCAP16192 [Drosera capensis]
MKTLPSKNKLMLCFRPIEVDSSGTIINDHVFSYITTSTNPTITATNMENHKISSSFANKKSNSPRRAFSAAIKSVFLDSSLRKSFRDRKNRKRPERSYSDISERTRSKHLARKSKSDVSDHMSKFRHEHSEIPIMSVDNEPLSPKSPQLSPNDMIVDRSEDARKAAVITREVSCLTLNYVVLLVLFISLVALFWGRSCAVMVTTTTMYAVQSISENRLDLFVLYFEELN